jgi:hypothetical protein
VVTAVAVATAAVVAVTERSNALRERGDTATTAAVSSRTTFRCYPAASRLASRLRYFAGARRREIFTPVHVATRRRALIDGPTAACLATL